MFPKAEHKFIKVYLFFFQEKKNDALHNIISKHEGTIEKLHKYNVIMPKNTNFLTVRYYI